MLTIIDIVASASADVIFKGRDSFSSINKDSRCISADEIFLAIKGERLDGHDFISEALSKCNAVIVNRDTLFLNSDGVYIKNFHIVNHDSKTTVLAVEDTLKALRSIASHLRSNFKGTVIAVVGSNGKTTTKELTSAVCSSRYHILKTEGNYNNLIGMPICISKLSQDTQVMVLELGANMPKEIDALCQISKPDIAVITNIGKEHLEGFGSLQGVIDSELEILPYVSTVVYNADDWVLNTEISKRFSGRLISYAIDNPNAVIKAENISFEEEKTSFDVLLEGKTTSCCTRLSGRFNVSNCLAAIAAGYSIGIDIADACKAIGYVQAVNMRFQIKKVGTSFFVLDVYNANPSSMQEAIKEAVKIKKLNPKYRLIAVLGDMLELGNYADEEHKNIVQMLNEHDFDFFLATGKHMCASASFFKKSVVTAQDSSDAGKKITKVLSGNDIVLIKGSRGLKMENVVDAIAKMQGCDDAL